MIVRVRVAAGAKKNAIVEEDGLLKVRVTAPAIEGRANRAVIAALADHFGVKRRFVRIVRGETSREKWIEVDTSP